MATSTETSRRLRLSAVVVPTTLLAAAVVAYAAWWIAERPITTPSVFDLVSTAVILGLAAFLVAPLRIGSTMYPQSLVDIAIMLGLMMLPTSWLLLATAVSIVTAKILARQAWWLVLFTAGKDVLTVVAATFVGIAAGLRMPFTPTASALPGLAAMAAAMICFDELLSAPVATLTGSRRARDGILVRLVTAVLRLGFAILAGWLLRHNARIAIAVPMLGLGLYLRYANQWERHADRLAWRRLAHIVDALGANDNAKVRRTAVLGAAELFGCEEVDLLLHVPGSDAILMRARSGAVVYEGPASQAPPAAGHVFPADLERRDPDDDLVSAHLATTRWGGGRSGGDGRSRGRRGRAAGPSANGLPSSAAAAVAPENGVPGNGVPGTRAPGTRVPGSVVPRTRVPGNGVPGNGASAAGTGGAGADGRGPHVTGAYPVASTNGGGQHADVLGQLRLRYRTPTQLGEREQYMLRALAAALGTAVRKSNAVAEAARIVLAGTHAFNHDSLTGLANRRHLLDFEALPDNGLAGLAVLDLTGFKEIVLALDHAVGDLVILTVAQRLMTRVDRSDIVARLSRTEFAVLFPRVASASIALERTRALVAAVSEPLRIDEVRLSVAPVAGLAVAGDGTVEELLRRADVALDQAKQSSQSISMYMPSWDTADVEQLSLSADLPRAVEAREFVAAFQPIVDLASGMMIAAEALARWPHPQLGQLPPGRFLSGIEQSGLLSAFTEQILDQALAGACSWRDAGFEVPVAVNVSPRSLLDPSFPEKIPAALERYGLPPDALTIEVTETVTLSQLEIVDDVLHTLREMGVTLALDDFGTGYSSLAMVARVPVHELKIDRSFVARLSGPTENAIVRSTIELGRTLGLLVVAEGVESEEQRRRLWEFGCPAGQGHLFSRPVDPAELLARLKRGRDGVPGTLAAPLHKDGRIIRLPAPRPAPEQRLHDELP